ncbi:MAG TPA: hypothetical protein VFC39_19380 [Acidobacteriaceae bacterium]|nr:hypothetical protein [Acidobacteriaceae bacterium]
MYFGAEPMFLLAAAKDGIQPPTPAFFRLDMSVAVSLFFLVSYGPSADVSMEARYVGRNP